MKTEDQLADILTKSLGRVKFVKLSAKIGVKKAWDMKKLKEENVGDEFLPPHFTRVYHVNRGWGGGGGVGGPA